VEYRALSNDVILGVSEDGEMVLVVTDEVGRKRHYRPFGPDMVAELIKKREEERVLFDATLINLGRNLVYLEKFSGLLCVFTLFVDPAKGRAITEELIQTMTQLNSVIREKEALSCIFDQLDSIYGDDSVCPPDQDT